MGIIGLGVGNEKEPVIADITGTYDHVAYLADGMVNMKKRNPKGRIESYCGPLADTSVCIGACTTSGALLEWFMKEINGDTGQEAYKAFWEKARFDGNGGVKVNPDFAGNEGSFSGLGLGIEKSDIFQGIIEALTLKMKEIIDDLISLKAGEVKKVLKNLGAQIKVCGSKTCSRHNTGHLEKCVAYCLFKCSIKASQVNHNQRHTAQYHSNIKTKFLIFIYTLYLLHYQKIIAAKIHTEQQHEHCTYILNIWTVGAELGTASLGFNLSNT